jgi:hypothetical protein
LKLKCDILLSTSAFEFNLRRYITESLVGYQKEIDLFDSAGDVDLREVMSDKMTHLADKLGRALHSFMFQLNLSRV